MTIRRVCECVFSHESVASNMLVNGSRMRLRLQHFLLPHLAKLIKAFESPTCLSILSLDAAVSLAV